MRTKLIGVAVTAIIACGAPTQPAGSTAPGTGDAPSQSAPSASSSPGGGSGGGGNGGTGPSTPDLLREIHDAVDPGALLQIVDEMTGGVAVNVGAQSVRITERWSPAGKAQFRAYWRQAFEALGLKVNEQTFDIPDLVGETQGHNLEAVLPGKSADSIVVIAHYDSVGVKGSEKDNPAVDDAASGLAIALATARILVKYPNRQNTVRFVAADYEEISNDLAGDAAYVRSIQQTAATGGFKVLQAINLDQTSWSCWSEDACGANAPAKNSVFYAITCADGVGSFPQIAKDVAEIASTFGTIKADSPCDGQSNLDTVDVYPFWRAGIPGVYFQEFGNDQNGHYDESGDDTKAHYDAAYHLAIARVAAAYQAKAAGVAR